MDGSADFLFGLGGLHNPIDLRSGTFSGSAEVSEETAQAIMNGETYVNIHSVDHGPGEIRGQIWPVQSFTGGYVASITPAAEQSGDITVVLAVEDADGLTDDESFTVTVTNVNDAPRITTEFPGFATDVEEDQEFQNFFLVDDVDNDNASLTLSGTSSNQDLIADAGFSFGSINDDLRNVTITPVANATGLVTVTLTISDPDGGSSDTSFDINLTPVNDPPTISAVDDTSSPEDIVFTVDVTIEDDETPVGDLIISVGSSNGSLAIASISDGTLTVTPAAEQSGSTEITLFVADGAGLLTTESFVLTIESVNDNPTISGLGSGATINEDTELTGFFNVADVESDAGDLAVTASSNNQDLIPDANIAIGGSGSSRRITLVPSEQQSGSATITVSVTDPDGGSSSTNFELTVRSVNDLPTIDGLADISVFGTDQVTINFTIGDVETGASDLLVSVTSSNQDFISDVTILIGGIGASRVIVLSPQSADDGTSATISVTVRDPDGSTTEQFTVTLTEEVIEIVAEISFSNGQITITWEGPGVLESADSLTGTHEPVPGVVGNSHTAPADAAPGWAGAAYPKVSKNEHHTSAR